MNDELIKLFAALNSQEDLEARFITPKTRETNYLEFKQKYMPMPALSEDDKKNFSKSLSSFSNAAGGLLIWGIKTAYTEDGYEYAKGLKPLEKVEGFAEALRNSLLDSVIPQNSSVQIEAIGDKTGKGFVKCLIPQSDHVPHRSMHDREYWIRLDGRTVRLEHYMIRDMMLRHAYPDLNLVLDPRTADLPLGQVKVNFLVSNNGRALAKHTGWFARIDNAKVITTDHCSDQTSLNNGRVTLDHAASLGSVIHPNHIQHVSGSVILERLAEDPIKIKVDWYCENMASRSEEFLLAL